MFDPRQLDLRHINLESTGLYAAARKATALAAARQRGWTPDSVRRAYNRFNRFWILGYWVEYGQQIRCAQEDGGTVLVTLTREPPRDQGDALCSESH